METSKCEYCESEATHETLYYSVCDKHWEMFKHIITRPDYPEEVIKFRIMLITAILFRNEDDKYTVR